MARRWASGVPPFAPYKPTPTCGVPDFGDIVLDRPGGVQWRLGIKPDVFAHCDLGDL
jgi:hypothetical protein